MTTLLETAQDLEGDELDAWLESLTLEEKKELWVRAVEGMMELLDQLVEIYYPEKEAKSGKVFSNDKGQEGTQSAQLKACCDAFWRNIFHRAKAPTRWQEEQGTPQVRS
jgi:hypothetical protein